MWTRRIWVSLMFLSAFMMAMGSAAAQSGFGVRAGASSTPDQFYLGAHLDRGISERFWFRPNAEVGVGNGLTLFSLNGEFVYDMPIKSSNRWVPYLGGGPAFLIGTVRTPFGRVTDTGGGFNFVGGIRQRKGFMGEIKIGAIDSPEFKLGIGWTW